MIIRFQMNVVFVSDNLEALQDVYDLATENRNLSPRMNTTARKRSSI